MALFKSTPRSDCVSEIQEAMVETGPAANASIPRALWHGRARCYS
jgi:hypothetical protein